MGLDMSLYLRYRPYEYKENIKEDYPEDLKLIVKDDGNVGYIATETYYEIAYWRKANAIHKYFVDRCADGIDQCQKTSVSLGDLEELVNICEQVLNNNTLASVLLPTHDGFFFGSIDYDDYYFEQIKYTYNVCSKIITFMEEQDRCGNYDWDIVYQSSW
jgi:hypothetical protein